MTKEEQDKIEQVANRIEEIAEDLGSKVDTALEKIDVNADRIDDLENEREAIKALPEKVGELKGMVSALQSVMTAGFDGVQKPLDEAAKSSSTKNAIQFASIVLVPIIVAIIGAIAVTHGGH